MHPEQYIGTAEAARILKVSRSTVTRRVARGEIQPVQRIDGYRGDLLFSREHIETAAAEIAA